MKTYHDLNYILSKQLSRIEKEIERKGYDNIYFVDDSSKNVDAVRRRLNKYPNIRKKVQLVKHD